jgi:hypothetical protein
VRKSVILTYRKKSTGRIVKRKVDPLSVRGNALGAWDHKRKAFRSFSFERIQNMEKSAFWQGFLKQAGGGGGGAMRAINVAALTGLAAPSAYHMSTGKDMAPSKYHALELGSLGTLVGTELAGSERLKAWGKRILRRGK